MLLRIAKIKRAEWIQKSTYFSATTGYSLMFLKIKAVLLQLKT